MYYVCCRARKRQVQKLNDQVVRTNQIVLIFGHKNMNSLNNYSNLNQNQVNGHF